MFILLKAKAVQLSIDVSILSLNVSKNRNLVRLKTTRRVLEKRHLRNLLNYRSSA